MTDEYLGFIGAIIGGAISGTVGLFIVRYTNKLQDKKQLKDNVYRKLYDYVFDLQRRNVPIDYSVSTETWSKIEPNELIRMDQKIRAEFDTLNKEIEIWNAFCRTLDNNYVRNEINIKKILQDAFSQIDLLNASGNITIKDSNMSVEGLVKMYLMVIMNPDIKDSEKLFKLMAEFIQKYYPFHAEEIHYLKENKPLFFDVLFKELPSLRQICLLDFNYAEMMKNRDAIKNHVAELNDQLEKLAK